MADTTPTQIRLTPRDKEKIAYIQEAMGLSFLASAIRYSIHRVYSELSEEPKKIPKKSRRRA